MLYMRCGLKIGHFLLHFCLVLPIRMMVTSLEFHQMVLHQKTRFPALAGSTDCVTIGSVVLTTAFD